MELRVSATEARVHFGEIMQRAIETGQPIVVEKGGKAQVVVLSVEEYERLSRTEQSPETVFEELQRVSAMVAEDLQGRLLPDAVEIIREEREKRSEQFIDLLGR
jgi:prevent-host-death family protein